MLASLIKRQKGFTLLEMLIVIVIIGILAVIIVPGLSSGPQRARDAQRKADIRGIKNAIETYYNDQNPGAYPVVAGASAAARYTALSTPLVTAYIPSLPNDPRNSGVFVYQYAMKDATASSAIAVACLENTKDSAVGSTTSYNTQQTIAACTSAILYSIQTLN